MYDPYELAAWEDEHDRMYGDRPATESEAHLEWHMNSGVPVGQPCPWDCCDPEPEDRFNAQEEWRDEPEPYCGVGITVGPAHDPYGTGCELEPGHTGKHRGPDPFGNDGFVEWYGGGSCMGDPLPVRDLEWVAPAPPATTWYVHRLYQAQEYGGPEEGGWWFDLETPIDPRSPSYMEPIEVHGTEEKALAVCRKWNASENERRKRECQYGYTSVLSYRDTFYSYDVQTSLDPHRNPVEWPHYE